MEYRKEILKRYIKLNEKLSKDLKKISNRMTLDREDGGYQQILDFEEKHPEIKHPNSESLVDIANMLYNISESCSGNIITSKELLNEK